MDKISVIITTYKRPFKVLNRAITSVLNQTYGCFELIVVNDTPKTSPLYLEISKQVKKYGDEVRYFASGINKGACYARNYGAEKANGKYIAFLDDDDEWFETKLEKQIEHIKKTNGVMVTCRQETIVKSKQKFSMEKIKHNLKYPNKKIDTQMLLKTNMVGGCSRPLISKKAFDAVNGFDEKMPASQDLDLWIRLSRVGQIYSINEKLLNYYIHGTDQISSNPKNRINANKLLIEKYKELAIDKEKFLKSGYMTIAYSYYLIEDINNGNRYFGLAKVKKGFSLTICNRMIKNNILKYRLGKLR